MLHVFRYSEVLVVTHVLIGILLFTVTFVWAFPIFSHVSSSSSSSSSSPPSSSSFPSSALTFMMTSVQSSSATPSTGLSPSLLALVVIMGLFGFGYHIKGVAKGNEATLLENIVEKERKRHADRRSCAGQSAVLSVSSSLTTKTALDSRERHTAALLAGLGFRVVLVCASAEVGQAIATAITRTGVDHDLSADIRVVEGDIGSLRRMRSLVCAVVQQCLGTWLSLIVNAAATTEDEQRRLFPGDTKRAALRVLSANYLGPYLFSELLLPRMTPDGVGVVAAAAVSSNNNNNNTAQQQVDERPSAEAENSNNNNNDNNGSDDEATEEEFGWFCVKCMSEKTMLRGLEHLRNKTSVYSQCDKCAIKTKHEKRNAEEQLRQMFSTVGVAGGAAASSTALTTSSSDPPRPPVSAKKRTAFLAAGFPRVVNVADVSHLWALVGDGTPEKPELIEVLNSLLHTAKREEEQQRHEDDEHDDRQAKQQTRRAAAVNAFAVSKLCNVIHSKIIARKYKQPAASQRVVSFSLHAGTPAASLPSVVGYFLGKTPFEQAQTILQCSTEKLESDEQNGAYFTNCDELLPSQSARDVEIAAALEIWTQEVLGKYLH